MFIDNKYLTMYNSIIQNAKNRDIKGYVEKHHIIPKSLGGTNDNNNIVVLTAREHFICHRLLTKITSGKSRQKMLYAVGRFVQDGGNVNRLLTSRQYEIARQSISEARLGTKFSNESKKKMSVSAKGRVPWNKGLRGVQKVSEEQKLALSKLHTGKTLTEDTKRKISESKKGHTSGMTGLVHSEETRNKMKLAQARRGKTGPQKRHKCHYCGEDNKTARHIKFCAKQ